MRPERILLLRSGRHLRVAMDALAARFPGSRIGVVGTPGSAPAIEQAGIAHDDVFTYEGARFQPLAFFLSRTAWAARRWRYDRFAILWNDPDGTGQGNVDRTACAMSPRGYLAITPDGGIVDRAVMPQLRIEALRAVASTGVVVVLGVLLYLPALVFGLLRRVNPAKAGLHDREYVESGFSRIGEGSSRIEADR
jgi:hypothetical protein